MPSTVELSEACCTLPPFKGSDYVPQGTIQLFEGTDMNYYDVGPKDSPICLISLYDIFGFHNSTFQGTDILSNALKARIIMPDFFKGNPWDGNNYPPPDRSVLLEWLSHTQWPQVEPTLLRIQSELKQQGVNKTGVYGFCWGGKMAIFATKLFGPAAIIHPSRLTFEDGKSICGPVLLIDSNGESEEDMSAFMDGTQTTSFAENCKRHRFDDMHHGFCSGRANFGDEKNSTRARQAYTEIAEFFLRNL